MTQTTTGSIAFPSPPEAFAGRCSVPSAPLTACLRDGARQMLIQAVEAEVAQWVSERGHLIDE